MHDVIVVDEEYSASINEATRASVEIEEKLSRYLEIMSRASAAGAVSGATAEALAVYVGYAEALKGMLTDIGCYYASSMSGFLADIDEADTYLY